jgi:endonuclease/exonuclease/phosphatase (EEP) superfamily protein YafD
MRLVHPDDETAAEAEIGIERFREWRRFPANRWLWWLVYLVAGATTLTLAVVAGLKVFYHDGIHFLTCLNAFTRYVYLPIYICAAWAVWQRRWGLVLIAATVVLLHLSWVSSEFVPDRQFESSVEQTAAAPSEAETIRIFFANVLRPNHEFDALFSEIEAANPDVVIFAEWGWGWHQAFEKSPAMAAYLFGASWQQPHYSNINAFSKRPIQVELQNWVSGRLVRTLVVPVGNETLRIIGLHAPRPMPTYAQEYISFWNQMIPLLGSEPTPLLVVGDFNATPYSLVYRKLQEIGLRSAHDDRGRGYATTWPNGSLPLPPIRIDQAFISRDLECDQIAEGLGTGSDHRPLIIDLRVRSRAVAP